MSTARRAAASVDYSRILRRRTVSEKMDATSVSALPVSVELSMPGVKGSQSTAVASTISGWPYETAYLAMSVPSQMTDR